MLSFARTMYALYVDGFRSMVLGRQLWKIILIKLVILFGVIKIFFFPDFLATTYSSDHERANHVLSALTMEPTSPPHEHETDQ
ncbi:DUF4492 domain-containing protein [Desulfoplanes formicivorans]|jgi:hypothetical protein|uniref:DUF4492 domain-containing protein n=1 Tax=Desulfoplanes formicivorans TaxID=1592317 RepID=A0A194ACB8_9BACT|nr:DUF4492 domain-containing protein [Desulfoplanes formicivorans]GAU07782.1 hypothetical protein DPF_0481 [Desulfoplanes formicivorans]